jgi:hypothetical protein
MSCNCNKEDNCFKKEQDNFEKNMKYSGMCILALLLIIVIGVAATAGAFAALVVILMLALLVGGFYFLEKT